MDSINPAYLNSVIRRAEVAIAAAKVDEGRIRLGRFAVPREVLVAAWILADRLDESEGSSYDYEDVMSNAGVDGLKKLFDTAVKSHYTSFKEGYNAVTAEMEHWRGIPENWNRDWESIQSDVEWLVLVESHPLDHHDFLIAGVTDYDQIESFIASEVDPELASAM